MKVNGDLGGQKKVTEEKKKKSIQLKYFNSFSIRTKADPNLSYSHLILSYTVALVSFTMLHCDWTSNRQ